VCVECLFVRSPGQAPDGANSEFCVRQKGDLQEVLPHPESLATLSTHSGKCHVFSASGKGTALEEEEVRRLERRIRVCEEG